MVLNEVLDKQAKNTCFLCMYYLYVCVSSDLCVHVEIRGQFRGVLKLVLYLKHVDPGDQTQATKLSRKYFYKLSHLPGPILLSRSWLTKLCELDLDLLCGPSST